MTVPVLYVGFYLIAKIKGDWPPYSRDLRIGIGLVIGGVCWFALAFSFDVAGGIALIVFMLLITLGWMPAIHIIADIANFSSDCRADQQTGSNNGAS